jgi:hypothetical protein
VKKQNVHRMDAKVARSHSKAKPAVDHWLRVPDEAAGQPQPTRVSLGFEVF